MQHEAARHVPPPTPREALLEPFNAPQQRDAAHTTQRDPISESMVSSTETDFFHSLGLQTPADRTAECLLTAVPAPSEVQSMAGESLLEAVNEDAALPVSGHGVSDRDMSFIDAIGTDLISHTALA